MERIRLSQIKPDKTFEQALFTGSGQKLLSAGVKLTPRHVQAIQRCGEITFYLADSIDQLVAEGVVDRFDDAKLSVGQKANRSVMTGGGRVVVEAGEAVEEHHLDALKEAGDSFVAKQEEQANQRRERILLADALAEDVEAAAGRMHLRIDPDPDASFYKTPPAPTDQWPDIEAQTQMRREHTEMLRSLYAKVEAGVEVSVLQFTDILDTLLSLLQRHPTRFPQLALLTPHRNDYLPEHAYTVTVLAMATAWQLRWPQTNVRELGLTGLLYDLGMLLVPERIRVGGCELTDIDRSRVQRHPVFSLAMLEPVEGVPMMSRIAALQHHERENGGGYPRGLRRDRIGDYAKVLAVCDTYAATTEPRHYRKPKLPYLAMEELLRGASSMYFCKRFARALIQAAGLFPVGSYVRLSSGANAAVVASNPEKLDRPVVQPLNETGHPAGEQVDLADPMARDVSVARPIQSATG